MNKTRNNLFVKLIKSIKSVKSNKIAQVELIGLIFIVVLVIGVMLIYLVYKINNPQENIRRGFVDKKLANDLLVTMMHSNVKECPSFTLMNLITDCANTNIKTIFCGSDDSCFAANRTANVMLQKTLPDFGREFKFNVEGTSVVLKQGVGCSGKDKVQGSQYFTLFPSEQRVRITLDIC